MAPPMPCTLPPSPTQAMAPHARGSGAMVRQAAAAALEVEGEAFVVRLAVLLDEAADGVERVVEHRDADVIGALGQRRGIDPAIAGGIVDLVVGPVDALLAVAADEVHAVGVRHGPGHLAARQRQRRLGHPAPGVGGLRRRAVEHVLGSGGLGDVDAAGLLQALVESAMMRVAGLLGARLRRRLQCDEGGSTGDKTAAVQERHGKVLCCEAGAYPTSA